MNLVKTEIGHIQATINGHNAIKIVSSPTISADIDEEGKAKFGVVLSPDEGNAAEIRGNGVYVSATGGGGSGIPPADVTDITAFASFESVHLTWTDPEDSKLPDGTLLSRWVGTKLVYKAGSYPQTVNDGIMALDNKTRNAHQTEPLIISGLTNGETYYFQFFSYSDTGAVNNNAENRVSATPRVPMIQFFAISGASGKVRLKIEKPPETDSVMIRYKTTPWADGDTISTGSLVANIEDDSNYKGANQWYEVSGLTGNTTYYFKAFPNGQNVAAGTNETKAIAGGLSVEHTFELFNGTALPDTSGNNINGTVRGYTTIVPEGITGNAALVNRPSATMVTHTVGIVSGMNCMPLSDWTMSMFFRIPNRVDKITFFTNQSDKGFFENRASFQIAAINEGKIYMQRAGDSGIIASYEAAFPDTNFDDGEFHFICVMRRSNVTTIRIDDIPPLTIPPNIFSAIEDTNTWIVGSGSISNASIQYQIAADQFRRYNRALEDWEVDILYNGGAGC